MEVNKANYQVQSVFSIRSIGPSDSGDEDMGFEPTRALVEESLIKLKVL